MIRIHQDGPAPEELMLDLEEIAREGAKRMPTQALGAEVEAHLEVARGERNERARALVVRNECATRRAMLCELVRLPELEAV